MCRDNFKKIFFLFVIFSSIAFAKIPKWFTETELPGYTLDFYITGTGNGASYDEAITKAQATIASQLRVTIKSELTSIEKEINEDDRISYMQLIESTSNSIVSETIEGVEIIKKDESGGGYYVFAVLSREKYSAGLKADLDHLWGQIVSLATNARKFIKQGKIFAALENYTDTQEIITPFYSKKAFYDAVASTPYFLDTDISLGDINSEIREILSGIQVNLISGDNQTGKMGKPLSEPIIFQIIYRRGTSEDITPIPNMPLIIEYGDDNLVEKLTTDQYGKVSCYVTTYSSGTSLGKIIARPNLYKLPALYRKYLNKAECVARFKISEEKKITFAVKIKDEKGKTLTTVERSLSGDIEELGHNVNPESNVLLSGVVELISTEEIEGYGGKQYVAISELSLSMINLSNNEENAGLTAKGKGMHELEKKAIDASYKKMKISKKELAEMLAKAENIPFSRIKSPAVEQPIEEKIIEKPFIKEKPSLSKSKIVEKNGFSIELQKCEMLDRDITFYLEVTNNEEDDRNFTVKSGRPDTKIFDDLGNEYKISWVKIANKKYTFGYQLTMKLISAVPVETILYFEKITKRAENITLLQINCGDFIAEFRDVPLKK